MNRVRTLQLGSAMALLALGTVAAQPAAADAGVGVVSAKLAGKNLTVMTSRAGKVSLGVSAVQTSGLVSSFVRAKGDGTVRLKLSAQQAKALRSAPKVRVVASQRRGDVVRVAGADFAPGKRWKRSKAPVCAKTIKKGVSARGCDLRGVDLRGMDLRGADLRKANLALADLTGAKVAGAELQGAVLVGARTRSLVGVPASLPTEARLADGDLSAPAVWETTSPGGWKASGSLVACDPSTPGACAIMDSFDGKAPYAMVDAGDALYTEVQGDIYRCDPDVMNSCTRFAPITRGAISALAYGDKKVFALGDQAVFTCPVDGNSCLPIVVAEQNQKAIVYADGWVYYGWEDDSGESSVYGVMRCRPEESGDCELAATVPGAVTGLETVGSTFYVSTGPGFVLQCDLAGSGACTTIQRLQNVWEMTYGDGLLFPIITRGGLNRCDPRVPSSCTKIAQLGFDASGWFLNGFESIDYGQGKVFGGRNFRGTLQSCETQVENSCTLLLDTDYDIWDVLYRSPVG